MKHFSNYMLMALLSILSMQVCAQNTDNGWVIENIHGPSQVGIVDSIPVDLNKDGLMDVVSASIEDGHLRAYINQGDSSFVEQYVSKNVPGIYRISAIDINNDGETDFLYPSIETQQVVVIIADENSKPFGYRKQIIADNILLPTDALAGDFNNDGLMDVVSISFESNAIYLHRQQPNGEFNTRLYADSILRPRKMVVTDYDNNGLVDFIVASEQDNSIRLYENTGGDVFNEVLISDQMSGTKYITTCEYNNDEYIDFMVSASAANAIYVMVNDGFGNFTINLIDTDTPGVNALTCADVNNDSQQELFGIAAATASVYSFSLGEVVNKQLIANTRDAYITLNMADFGLNLGVQVVTQSYFEGRNLLYQPMSWNLETVVWEDFPDGAFDVRVGDIDGDGADDLVYSGFYDDTIYWTSQLIKGKIHVIFDQVDGPQSVTTADFDEDGDLDVFSAGAWDDSFWFHENKGQGSFNTIKITSNANNAARIEVMDVNGDGKPDLVGTSSLDDSLRWFDWQGSVFVEQLIDDQLDGAQALSTGDYNQDGYQDIAVGSFFGNEVSVFINDGLGQFQKYQLSTDKLKPTTIISADVDGDMDIDLVFNASQAGTVWMLENTKTGFEEILVTSRGAKINSLALLDVAGDGQLDVVNISDQQGEIYISKAFGGQVFSTRLIFQNQMGMRSIKPMPNSSLPSFAIASNITNSIQVLTQMDHIFISGFETK